MLTRYACTAAELSCVIGNIFAELSPPCAACGAEVLQITGTTVTGNAATLTVTEAGFDFDGCADGAYMQRPERERKEPTEFNVIVKAKDLVKHTFTITNSTERYPKKYRFTLVNRIQDKAVDIYECVLEANELDLRDAQEYRQRQKLQAKALTYCKELLFFIELSQEMGFISMSSCEYWSKLALEVKYMTTAWKKRDKTRA